MADDKKIEEAATIASISDTEKGRVKDGYVVNALADHENGYREGYIEGAKWAINEFITYGILLIRYRKNLIITDLLLYIYYNIIIRLEWYFMIRTI